MWDSHQDQSKPPTWRDMGRLFLTGAGDHLPGARQVAAVLPSPTVASQGSTTAIVGHVSPEVPVTGLLMSQIVAGEPPVITTEPLRLDRFHKRSVPGTHFAPHLTLRRNGPVGKLSGVMTVMITPLKNDGSVNYQGFTKNINWQIGRAFTGLSRWAAPVSSRPWKTMRRSASLNS